jgi:hypothetical protein
MTNKEHHLILKRFGKTIRETKVLFRSLGMPVKGLKKAKLAKSKQKRLE